MPLSYAPGAAGSGTLTLDYSYTNNAGNPATGTVSIPYASTVHDTVSGAVSPVRYGRRRRRRQPGSDRGLHDQRRQHGQRSRDCERRQRWSGFAARRLERSPGSATTFACSSISSGAGCTLTLTYAPMASASGTLSLNFSYLDNAGTAQARNSQRCVCGVGTTRLRRRFRHWAVHMLVDPTAGTLANCQTTGGFGGAWTRRFLQRQHRELRVRGRRAESQPLPMYRQQRRDIVRITVLFRAAVTAIRNI